MRHPTRLHHVLQLHRELPVALADHLGAHKVERRGRHAAAAGRRAIGGNRFQAWVALAGQLRESRAAVGMLQSGLGKCRQQQSQQTDVPPACTLTACVHQSQPTDVPASAR